jgi:hypothetical protein
VSAAFQFSTHILVALFMLGLVGSFIVIVVTFIEDLELLFADEESTDASAKT